MPTPVPSVMLLRKIEIIFSPVQIQQQKKNQEKSFKELQKKMEDLDTAPIITRTIIRGLRHAHNGTIPSPYSSGGYRVDQLFV
mmetsp:Transcript_26302/g.28311  ORF Transcript_26302/g.28311 Transcript_26302/m.28311 type:complete len:83 (+) Transcript_26302:139-387(+)